VYVDRGELGRIWRLHTDRGRWAVKEFDVPGDETAAAADVAFQQAAAAEGVPLPRPVLTRDGQVLLGGGDTGLPASTLRVYEWVDLIPEVFVDARGIGAMASRIHRVEHPAARPVEAWFAEPIGDAGWHRLLEDANNADAAWAPALAHWLAELIELDAEVAPHDPSLITTCHRDVERREPPSRR
jgi:Ser/Thr protein kinase RdoA (MazF antagonist)